MVFSKPTPFLSHSFSLELQSGSCLKQSNSEPRKVQSLLLAFLRRQFASVNEAVKVYHICPVFHWSFLFKNKRSGSGFKSYQHWREPYWDKIPLLLLHDYLDFLSIWKNICCSFKTRTFDTQLTCVKLSSAYNALASSTSLVIKLTNLGDGSSSGSAPLELVPIRPWFFWPRHRLRPWDHSDRGALIPTQNITLPVSSFLATLTVMYGKIFILCHKT